ncbi:hypothetical protein CHL76_14385 [Marinococcus halophilus]|uniref:Probable membrane transporter protein n=1 Tax=Marinococcus halophilus TaxID=1371 RepID=A0A510Y9P0_MARHA|nr:sulfite exporter TauE/SafE family protein [Marinococcus halophilus]OZT79140.1 hypothetical protein CHL76_14385 [Marinococcus halophilus]GEK59873.1 UPF0721 transmembrane protein YrkJ [Marinococcus halophilus]
MTVSFLITVFVLGAVGSYISGLVGVGGSIINYPLLLYVPALLGVGSFTAHDVSGAIAVQVLFATVGGVWGYRKGSYLHASLIGYMGTSIIIGSLLGSLFSGAFSESMINITYALLATIAVIMMVLPQQSMQQEAQESVSFSRWIAAGSAFVVGVSAGIVGAAGAFILVPIMLVVLKIPTRVTIATSLAVTLLSSIGTSAGKLITGQVPFLPAAVLIAASLLAAPLGAKTARHVQAKWLQRALAVLLLGVAVEMWIQMLI